MHEYYQKFAELLKQDICTRKTILSGNDIGNESISSEKNGAVSTKNGLAFGPNDQCETIISKPHLVIYGAGHVSYALCTLARLQSMETTVLDDRPELLNEKRFPTSERRVGSFASLLSKPLGIPGSYHVIVTSGHVHDAESLAFALRDEHQYIGMIGSKRKIAATYDMLRKQGFTNDDFASVHSPIGLLIGGDTPEEIAISIMAEIIQCCSSVKHRVLIDPALIATIASSSRSGVVIRVLSAEGSTPSREGAMLFWDGEKSYGTVGGGDIEVLALEKAKTLTENAIVTYDLSGKDGCGMICGGKATLLYQIIR